MKIYDIFLNNVKKNPNKVFLKNEKNSYKYSEINKLINNFEKNKFKGKFITIIDTNSVYYFVLYILCSKINKTLVTIDHNNSFKIIEKQINEFKLNNIFCDNSLKKKLILINPKLNFISNIKNGNLKKNLKKNLKCKHFLLTFSSGSSSKPKPIILSEETKILRAKSNIDIFNLKSKDRLIISTPLHHTLAIRLMTIGIILGSEIFYIERYSLDIFLNNIKKNKSKFTFFVSNQISEMLRFRNNISKLKSLNCIVSSSAKLNMEIKTRLIKLYKKKIYEIYGLSEAAVVTNLNLKKDYKFAESVGKVIPGVKIKIDYLNNKKFGEILVKSKYLCTGYYLNNGIKYLDRNNYFRTGDLGYLRNNFLYFKGRNKNMVKINGVSIFLDDIVSMLKEDNYVEDCVAIPIERENNINPRICLLYEKSTYNTNQIKKFCLNKLQIYQVPTYYFKIDKIPKNKMNKLNMIEIKKIVTNKLKIN